MASHLNPIDFDDVVGEANHYSGHDRTETFGRLVLGEIKRVPGPARVLDVGCGSGLGFKNACGANALSQIRNACGELWGCEPDPDIVPSPLLQHFARGILEEVELPDHYFDLIYAHYVVEHVIDPTAFLQKAHHLLRPGGRLLFITPNARHYFVKVARLVAAFNVEENVLGFVSKAAADAHYPVRYRLNDEDDIRQAARATGFSRSAIAYFEHGDVRPYAPYGLRFVPIVMEKVMRAGGRTRLPGLVARLER